MKKGYLLFLVLLFTTQGLWSQKLQLSLQSGLGNYSMTGLKQINRLTQNNLPFETKLTDNFPTFFYYQPMVLIRFKNISTGLTYSYQSTGSRVTAQDYSGNYRLDMLVKSQTPGLFGDVHFSISDRLEFAFYSEFDVAFSRLEIKENFIIFEEEIKNTSDKFNAMHFLIEPGANIAYSICNKMNVGLYFGYSFQLGKQTFHDPTNKSLLLIEKEYNTPVKPEWNGFRAGLSVSYLLF